MAATTVVTPRRSSLAVCVVGIGAAADPEDGKVGSACAGGDRGELIGGVHNDIHQRVPGGGDIVVHRRARADGVREAPHQPGASV